MNIKNIKIALMVLFIAITTSCVYSAVKKITRSQMQTMHRQNTELEAKAQELKKELRRRSNQVLQAQKALANYQYVKAENEKFIETISPQ